MLAGTSNTQARHMATRQRRDNGISERRESRLAAAGGRAPRPTTKRFYTEQKARAGL